MRCWWMLRYMKNMFYQNCIQILWILFPSMFGETGIAVSVTLDIQTSKAVVTAVHVFNSWTSNWSNKSRWAARFDRREPSHWEVWDGLRRNPWNMMKYAVIVCYSGNISYHLTIFVVNFGVTHEWNTAMISELNQGGQNQPQRGESSEVETGFYVFSMHDWGSEQFNVITCYYKTDLFSWSICWIRRFDICKSGAMSHFWKRSEQHDRVVSP